MARRGSVTDLSPGMVKVATRNGRSLGLDIDGRVADAEGHPHTTTTPSTSSSGACLHHIPDVEMSLREVVRVLRPGGRFVFAGEPTTVGNAYARAGSSTLTWKTTASAPRNCPAWASWRRPQAELDEILARRGAGVRRRPAHLRPRPTWSGWRTNAGAVQVRTASEEFTAAMLGLAGARPSSRRSPGQTRLGLGEIRVRRLDGAELGRRQRVAPGGAQGWFYNVMITGVKPS